MKTGGTMNFLKRAGAILMLVAVFASSCNKYADDFKQLNTKLDALATTVAGVTTLVSDNAALKAQVTALQTAVAGLPTTASITALTTGLAGVTTKIDAITTTLNAVAAAGIANKAVVDQLVKDLAALSTKVTSENDALTAKIVELGTTDAAQTQALTDIKQQNTDLATSIANLSTQLAGLAQTGSATDTATALTIQGLQLMLNAQKLQLDQILLNTSMYNGDVNITTAAEVTFYLAKLSMLGIINGNLNINTTAFTAAQMVDVNKITSNITAVIGTGNVTVLDKAGNGLDLSKLASVKGDYAQLSAAVTVPALTSVGGSVIFDFDGPYSNTTITSIGKDLSLVIYGTASPVVGTTSINFTAKVSGYLNNVGLVAGVYTPIAATIALAYPDATSVIAGGKLASLTANKATVITLTSATQPGSLGITTTKVAAIDLSALTTIAPAGTLGVSAAAGSTINLSNLKTTKTADAFAVTLAGFDSIDLPKYAVGVLTSADATIVSLGSYFMMNAAGENLSTLGAVKTLTLGAIKNLANLDLIAPASLVTATVNGATAGTGTVTASSTSAKLKTLNVGGTLSSVSVSDAVTAIPLLTNVNTTGNINAFTLNNADAVTATGLTLGHNYIAGGVGSDLTITNNLLLTTVTSSSDMLRTLVITGNSALANLDLSSYKSVLFGGAINLTIAGNALKGTYTNAVVAGVLPYTESILASSALTTLKPMIAAWKAATTATVPTSTSTLTYSFGLDVVKYSTGTAAATTLATKLGADAAHSPAFSSVASLAGTGAAAYTDFLAIVQ